MALSVTLNDHKTSNKRSSFAQFQVYDNTKKRSASGGWALPLDPAWGTAPDPRYRLALRARHMAPNLYSWIRPCAGHERTSLLTAAVHDKT